MLVFDQALSEVSAVGKLAVRIDRFRHVVGRVIELGRFVGAVGRIWDPSSFTRTSDAWDAAEQIEPYLFALYSSFRAVKRSGPRAASDGLSTILGDDLSLRLTYVERLLADLAPNSPVELSPRQKRQREQQILDDPSVPPDVRLILCKARSLPALVLMYTLEVASGHAHPLVPQAIREGLDSMIAFALGVHACTGKLPVAAPSGLGSDVPEPMDLRGIEARWRAVQEIWST